MSSDGFDVNYPRAVLYALTVLTAVTLVITASTSGSAFGAYNTGWHGASTLRTQAETVGTDARIIHNTSAYGDGGANETIAIVLSPDREYTETEAARVREFVRDGGTLVVAEDFGDGGNELLGAVGATARFDGTPLRDERFNYRSPAMPDATNVSNHSLTAGVERLTLNHGTVVNPGNATVLVRSSGYAYLDADRDGEPGDAETFEERPVATVETVGDGRVVAVADPSLFINAMQDREGNQQFARTLFASGDRALLDYSHTATIPPLALAILVVRETVWLQVVAVVAALTAIGVWGSGWTTRGIRLMRQYLERSEPDTDVSVNPDELATYLRNQHPDWDDEYVRQVASRVVSSEEGTEPNE